MDLTLGHLQFVFNYIYTNIILYVWDQGGFVKFLFAAFILVVVIKALKYMLSLKV